MIGPVIIDFSPFYVYPLFPMLSREVLLPAHLWSQLFCPMLGTAKTIYRQQPSSTQYGIYIYNYACYILQLASRVWSTVNQDHVLHRRDEKDLRRSASVIRMDQAKKYIPIGDQQRSICMEGCELYTRIY